MLNAHLSHDCMLLKSRERYSNGYVSTCNVGSLVVYFIVIKSTFLIKHHYRYNGSPISQLMESAMKKNRSPLQSLSLVIEKRLSEHILSITIIENFVFKSYDPLFLFSKHRSGFSLTFTGNILGTVS